MRREAKAAACTAGWVAPPMPPPLPLAASPNTAAAMWSLPLPPPPKRGTVQRQGQNRAPRPVERGTREMGGGSASPLRRGRGLRVGKRHGAAARPARMRCSGKRAAHGGAVEATGRGRGGRKWWGGVQVVRGCAASPPPALPAPADELEEAAAKKGLGMLGGKIDGESCCGGGGVSLLEGGGGRP